ncbi:triacylglycerol lipase [Synechococcus sp. CCY 9618]|uniref:esterase/lipase family protein n=1 Tax=Synechococcus sp. CCY 9618 TaxID=2815602 RepID=UPI0020B39FDB|nr:alpha/beta fold hydrolase [Synechococcus sp. CCY 9618]
MTIPLVLVHGLWDDPRLFRRLQERLAGRLPDLYAPHLSHRCGATPLPVLADRLGTLVEERYGPGRPIDLLGFSMGGVIARQWLQRLGGHRRTRRFFSVGSPQNGTLTAQPWPGWLVAGIADMKRGSPLLRRLNDDLSSLEEVECHSYVGRFDHMVIPPGSGVLPLGSSTRLPVWNHRNLIRDRRALDVLVQDLLRP